jgi:ribosome-associated toxin RatA of RatAB toxin-antitoxin module
MATPPGTSATVEIAAPPGVVLDVVADVEKYPVWTSTVAAVRVLGFEGDGWPDNVEFTVTGGPLKDTYTVDYDWDITDDGTGEVTFALVSSGLLSTLDGLLVLRSRGSGAATEVTYRLALDVTVPMLGLLKRRVERSLVSAFLDRLRAHVEATVRARERG